MAGNVVEVVVQATDATGPGFASAKAGAEGAAEGMGAYAAAVDKATAAQAKFDEAQTEQAAAAAKLKELQASGAASADELAAATQRLTEASLTAADARKTLASAEADVAAKTKIASDEQVAAGVKSEESGGLMAGMGSKVKMAGLGIAVGMGLAVKSAMDFQASTTKLVTSAGESASQLGMLQQGILGISSQTATSSEELSKGLYMISSAGITGAGGLNVLKAAAEGAKSEGADLGEVTNALTSGLNAYGMNTKTSAAATVSATSMMNQMLQTVSQGKMTFQELAGSLSAVLPIAAANKISYAQVGGALATMTSMGVSAQQGTQNLAFVIRSLANPSSVAVGEMNQMGISSVSVSKNLGKLGLTGTIQELSNAVTARMGPAGVVITSTMNQSKTAAADAQTMLAKLPASIQGIAKEYLAGSITQKDWMTDLKGMPPLTANLAKEFANTANNANGFNALMRSGSPAAQTYAAAMSKLLGGATGLNVGLMLTGAHAKTFADNVAAIGAASDGTSGKVAGFSEVQKTTAFQMAQLSDSVKAAGTELGLALLPAVSAVLKPLASFASYLAQNKDAAIAFAVIVGGVLAGAIGTKAVKAITDFKDAMKTVAGGIEAVVKKIVSLTAAQDEQAGSATAAAATSEAASEETAAAAETAAGEQVAAAEEVAAANEEAAATSSSSWLMSAARTVASGVAWVAQSIAKVAVLVAANVAGALATAAAWVVANAVMLLGIGLVIAAVVIAVYEIVKHWKSIVHGVEEAWDAVYHAVSVAVSTVVDFVKSHWQLLIAILTGPIGIAVLLIRKYWGTITSDASKFASDVTGTISRFASDVLGFFTRMANDVTGAERKMISAVIGDVRKWFSDFLSIEQSGLTNIVHWFEGLPARILSGLGNIGSLLFNAGRAIIQGLINGVTSMVSSVTSTVSGIVSDIKSFLPFSPAKRGPLSGAGSPENSGRSIAMMLASGMSSGAGPVRAAAAALAGSAGISGAGGALLAGAGAAGSQHTVTFDFTGSSQDMFVRAIRNAVRVTGGGNVQKAFGTG